MGNRDLITPDGVREGECLDFFREAPPHGDFTTARPAAPSRNVRVYVSIARSSRLEVTRHDLNSGWKTLENMPINTPLRSLPLRASA